MWKTSFYFSGKVETNSLVCLSAHLETFPFVRVEKRLALILKILEQHLPLGLGGNTWQIYYRLYCLFRLKISLKVTLKYACNRYSVQELFAVDEQCQWKFTLNSFFFSSFTDYFSYFGVMVALLHLHCHRRLSPWQFKVRLLRSHRRPTRSAVGSSVVQGSLSL